jgi:hypothetical protein
MSNGFRASSNGSNPHSYAAIFDASDCVTTKSSESPKITIEIVNAVIKKIKFGP